MALFLLRTILIALGILVGLLQPSAGFAQECPIVGLSCVANLPAYLQATVGTGMLMAFSGILIAMLIAYALRLAFSPGDESAVTETRSAFAHAFLGALLVTGAAGIAASFVDTGAAVDTAPLEGLVHVAVVFVKSLLAALLLANFFIQGVLLIVAMDDSLRSKARTRMLHGAIGAAIVMLADAFIATVVNRDISIATQESVGIANFLGTIFGLLAVVGIIAGGIMYVISVDESLKDKGKSIIRGSLIALAVVIASYALVATFIF